MILFMGQGSKQLKVVSQHGLFIVRARFWYSRQNKFIQEGVTLRPHPLLHVCLVLTFGIELHIYRSALSRKKKKKSGTWESNEFLLLFEKLMWKCFKSKLKFISVPFFFCKLHLKIKNFQSLHTSHKITITSMIFMV